MSDIIKEREQNLNDVTRAMENINQIAKQINVKVHEQRSDLEIVDQNTTAALANAKEGEKNIEEAQEH